MKPAVFYKIVTLSLFLSVSFSISGKEVEVKPKEGVDALAEAIMSSAEGDTLCLESGTYQTLHTIEIKKPITIIGCGDAVVVAAEKEGILEIRSHDVHIEGLTFEGVGRSYIEDLAAIWVDNSTGFSIVNNRINESFFAIFCTQSEHGLIENNVIVGDAVTEASSGNAIHLWYCDSVEIVNNNVNHHRDGIYLEFTDHSTIRNNYSWNNLRYGLHFMYSHYNVYESNTFEQNGAGVAVMFSNFITMTKNLFLNNWGDASYGLLLKEIRDSEISSNHFDHNTMGVFMEGCSRLQIEKNIFEANGWAMKVRGSSDDNDITNNIFDGNSFDLASESKKNPNRYYRNYWDNYHGYDLNRDGYGDIPHRPMSLFSHMTTRWDESILLIRSSFIEALNFAEDISPSLTPTDLVDSEPLMKRPHL